MSDSENMVSPTLTQEQVFSLMEQQYGLNVKSCVQLDGYDDKNYRIQVDDDLDSSKNLFIEKLHPHGYVLKILNSLDSQNKLMIEGQNGMMFHLVSNDFRVPTPEKNVSGEFYSFHTFGDGKSGDAGTVHIVRLLKYQIGTKLNDVNPCHEIYFNVGVLTAKIDTCLSTFHHPGFENLNSNWALYNAPMIMKHINVVTDSKRRQIVEQHITDFKNDVLAAMPQLEKGIIHGDINEHNILVEGTEISALLDFGDANCAPYLFEAAIAICYILVHSSDISYGKSFLSGYNRFRVMPELEKKILRTCVCTRLCQSLVLGAYSGLKDPTNKYILSSQKTGWPILEKLSAISNEELINLWNQ
ncbi:hydroxylysine kinase [Cimex lectularius]|uniref:Hydroxylysine kinase n=1 Tax=Cimex lectularius TaxID=79782 RepID=A0A8I6SCP2_CIMLE|nr:hydroxylysine kinase [Cimex lectularius]XP_014259321.1 hydroxylysine kinase [Cimex lectularius]XP_014259322.1 hydroxylysine kinase [Cimex lectularius]